MWKGTQQRIKVLAFCYRYVFSVVPPMLVLFFAPNVRVACLLMGAHALLYSAYSVIGYHLRWKHIYCADQNAKHQKMTPTNISWDKMTDGDAYGIPIIFTVVGVVFLVCAAFV